MGDTAISTEKATKRSWFKGIKSELKKIVWPDKESLSKQTLAVVAISVALGIIIAIIDFIIQYGVKFLIG